MKKFNGSAITRHQVFTLSDGSYVVQWDDNRVQELLSGQYRPFDHARDFGHAITDYELKQLRVSGRVEHYNHKYVWLLPLPEGGRFGERRVMGKEDRIRAFYLTTSLPKSEIAQAQQTLNDLGFGERFFARARDSVVVVLGKHGIPFRTFQEAEQAQEAISMQSSQVFSVLSIAFIETSSRTLYRHTMDSNSTKLNLDELIASQSNTANLVGKRVVLVVKQEEEREAFGQLFTEMQLDVKVASSAVEALQFLEDFQTDLLIADIQLSDMHVFQMLSKAKEIESLRDLPVMVLTDQPYFGTTVAKVDYMQRPISIARLRYNVYIALNGKQSDSSTDGTSSNPS